ncbi:MAG: acyl-CoA dehydrogenase [Pseudomonadota bacterium]
MTYQAPLADILFNIEHLSSWEQVTSREQYIGIDQSDVRAVLEEFGRFCSETVAPLSRTGDELGAHIVGGTVRMPDGFDKAHAQFVKMGWHSLQHPPEYGGMGLPRVVGAAATEILNGSDMSFGLCPLLTDGAIDALLISGSEDQRARYLEPLIVGRWSGTMNLTEPQAGSDLGRVLTKAEPNDDGSYSVSGTKIFITYGEHELSENIVHLVLARTPGAPDGSKGLSLFLVPKFMVEADGSLAERNRVECVSIEHKLGVRASPTAILQYTKATGFLIGEENRGLEYMFVMTNAARFAVGVQGIGVSERALQQALTFAQERVQSRPVDGLSKTATAIIEHPDVRRMLMRMRALTEGGRALAVATAGWLDLAHDSESADQGAAGLMAEFLVPQVKAFCSERSLEVTSLGVQVHGGMGYVEETGAAQLCRDARILPIYEGTTAIQANDLLGRKVMRDAGNTAQRFLSMVRETSAELREGGTEFADIATGLATAADAFEASLVWLLETVRENPNAAYAGSVPFLMLAGNLAAGWQLGRAALAAQAKLQEGDTSPFLKQKMATARFYANHILIECETERLRITSGAMSILDPDLPI